MEMVTDFKDLGKNIELTIEKPFKDETIVRQIIIPKDVIKGILESLEETND